MFAPPRSPALAWEAAELGRQLAMVLETKLLSWASRWHIATNAGPGRSPAAHKLQGAVLSPSPPYPPPPPLWVLCMFAKQFADGHGVMSSSAFPTGRWHMGELLHIMFEVRGIMPTIRGIMSYSSIRGIMSYYPSLGSCPTNPYPWWVLAREAAELGGQLAMAEQNCHRMNEKVRPAHSSCNLKTRMHMPTLVLDSSRQAVLIACMAEQNCHGMNEK
eukprot:scaffold258154_cov18-Tisochrysis_lutea.AAC.1